MFALGQLLPPGSVFGELTAAALYGWWLPPLPSGLPITALLPPGSNRLRRAGLRTRRTALGPTDRSALGGVPLTSPVRTLMDLAGLLATVDLVVLADSAVRAGHCTIGELIRAGEARGTAGVRTLRRAVALLDPRSESPWETLLRLLHALSGLPPVEPQADLFDDDGVWIARADLLLVGTRRLHEYDGDTHRDRDRHRRDLAREKRLSRAAYERYGFTASELLGRPGLVIRDAEAAFGLDHNQDRLHAWLDEIRPSLFTAAGRERLARTLRPH